ncbi:MAG: hypothetical protein HZB65_02965 [Candidatus Aenigmarchaeota archaeon]|nr:hypothetical protein [Candidatus Aenigmarchaeota archaeon]
MTKILKGFSLLVRIMDEIDKLKNENIAQKENCEFCKEAGLKTGQKTSYGSVIIFRIGSDKDGWFATLSPRTGGDPTKNFTLQLMPFSHLTHFSQMNENSAKNFGIAFAKLSDAMSRIMAKNPALTAMADNRDNGIALAIYGKCTTWKEKKEHLHIKLFQFRDRLSQPSVVDSTFGRKEIFNDGKEDYVKMKPVKKIAITNVNEIAKELINILTDFSTKKSVNGDDYD